MQLNVNAECVRDYATERFGADNVVALLDGIIKISVKGMANDDISCLSRMLQWSDVYVKRSDKGLIILLNPRQQGATPLDPAHYEDEPALPKKQPRVLDFYEALPQEARMAAFDNTAKTKWTMPVNSLEEAIMRSFYIDRSPEGAEYWQNVMLNNIDNLIP